MPSAWAARPRMPWRRILRRGSDTAGFRPRPGMTAVLLPLVPLFLSVPILGPEDAAAFLRWWAAFTLPALIWFPLTARLFPGQTDGGWLFAKPLALALGALTVWTL